MYKSKKGEKMKKKLYRFIQIVTLVIIFLLIINIIPPKKAVSSNPFLTDGLPMVSAHRGGRITYPENTLKAFKWCVNELNVDILEFDLYLTKDDVLVINHDSYINRTTDVEEITNSKDRYLIKDHDLNELNQFNFGYKFEKDGEFPYRDIVGLNDDNREVIIHNNDLGIVTLSQVFENFYSSHPDLLFIIEIKDEGSRGEKAAEIFYQTLSNYPNYLNNVVASSFNKEVENYFKETYPDLHRGASVASTASFVVTQYLKVNLFNFNNFSCLQLPLEMYGVDLTGNTIIRRAHRRGMAVQYWTINDADEMRMLIKKGVDAIMTDDPLLLIEVLKEFK